MNPPTKQAARLPKARVMYCHPADLSGEYEFTVSKSADPSDDRLWTYPVAVIPGAGSTNRKRLQSARALIRVAGFFAMGAKVQHEKIKVALDIEDRTGAGYDHAAYLVMRALGLTDKTFPKFLTLIASGGARK